MRSGPGRAAYAPVLQRHPKAGGPAPRREFRATPVPPSGAQLQKKRDLIFQRPRPSLSPADLASPVRSVSFLDASQSGLCLLPSLLGPDRLDCPLGGLGGGGGGWGPESGGWSQTREGQWDDWRVARGCFGAVGRWCLRYAYYEGMKQMVAGSSRRELSERGRMQFDQSGGCAAEARRGLGIDAEGWRKAQSETAAEYERRL